MAALADLRQLSGGESPNTGRFVRRRLAGLTGLAALGTLVAVPGVQQLVPSELPLGWRVGLDALGVVVVVSIPCVLLVITVVRAGRHVRWEVTEGALHAEVLGPRKGRRLVRPLALIEKAGVVQPVGAGSLGIATLIVDDLELHHLDAKQAALALNQISAIRTGPPGRPSLPERDRPPTAEGTRRLTTGDLYRVRPAWFVYYIVRLGPHATFLFVVLALILIAAFG